MWDTWRVFNVALIFVVLSSLDRPFLGQRILLQSLGSLKPYFGYLLFLSWLLSCSFHSFDFLCTITWLHHDLNIYFNHPRALFSSTTEDCTIIRYGFRCKIRITDLTSASLPVYDVCYTFRPKARCVSLRDTTWIVFWLSTPRDLWVVGNLPKLVPQLSSRITSTHMVDGWMSPSGRHTKIWNDTEKISMAPAQGWHALTEWMLFGVQYLFFIWYRVPTTHIITTI